MNLKHKLHRLKHLPGKEIPKVLLSRLLQKAKTELERSLYDYSTTETAESRSLSLNPNSLIHPDVFKPGFSSQFQKKFPEDFNQLIRKANQYENLIFDVLGSGPIDFREFRGRKDLKIIKSHSSQNPEPGEVEGRIPWHFDFKSGVGWDPKEFYADIKFGTQPGVDIKTPWELSRCHHFVTLGQAYRLTHEDRYVKTILNHWDDWIHQNPLKYGVNWASPMDAAIRAINWTLALSLVWDSKEFTGDWKKKAAHALAQHGRHIHQHLEYAGSVSTNHYLSNLLGLAFIGVSLGKNRWVSFAEKEFKKQILEQTTGDGFSYEASSAYHKLDMEIFGFFSVLVGRTDNPMEETILSVVGQRLGTTYVNQLNQMGLALKNLMRPDGSIPLIGDNDSGRICRFFDRKDEDVRYLLGIWGSLTREAGWQSEQGVSEPIWIFGFSGFDGIEKKKKPAKKKGASSSGLISLKGSEDVLTFVAQANGTRGVGNHTHNDKLSFTLWIKGEDFIVDPGTFVYTSDETLRNRYRSTRYHNTVEVDGQEQNRFIENSPFSLKEDSSVRLIEWREGRCVAALHTGYSRLEDPVLHTRKIERLENPFRWKIVDELEGHEEHQLLWSFVLEPQIECHQQDNQQCELVSKSGGRLKMKIHDVGAQLWVEEGHVAPAYGLQKKTKIIRVQLMAKLPHKTQIDLEYK